MIAGEDAPQCRWPGCRKHAVKYNGVQTFYCNRHLHGSKTPLSKLDETLRDMMTDWDVSWSKISLFIARNFILIL
jgi:hypothetical protein